MEELSKNLLFKLTQKTFVNVSVYNKFLRFRHLVSVTGTWMTKENFLKKLGRHIAQTREKAGLSQSELALRCDKDRQSINRLEKGRMNPTAYYLSELAAELNIPMKDLLDFE
jgi:ribosome-binding protein aMBF1 (putative translation factor)